MTNDRDPDQVELLTLSFRGDLELCQLLCESADRFLDRAIQHIIAVPRADMRLFAPLADERRRLIAQEDLLPSWLMKLPLPPPVWRRRLFLPRRNMYVSLRGQLVRGWIAQQLMKLAAAAASEAAIIVHIDSDAAFIRPTDPSHFMLHGRPRFLRDPGAGDSPMHAQWHRTASRLLGLPTIDYHGADYIDAGLVVWRRENVHRLIGFLDHHPHGWREALIKSGDFSEYVLYGVFTDAILGAEANHSPTPVRQCLTLWDASALRSAQAAIEAMDRRQRAMAIQSTLPLDVADRRALIAQAVAKAAAQDCEEENTRFLL